MSDGRCAKGSRYGCMTDGWCAKARRCGCMSNGCVQKDDGCLGMYPASSGYSCKLYQHHAMRRWNFTCVTS